MNFNEAIEIAKRTWYPKDHELHLNPHHPMGKLLGEWGELLDDYMKSIYKPGYVFEPEDELGDIWYYVRILCYQSGHNPTDGDYYQKRVKTECIISDVMTSLSREFSACVKQNRFCNPVITLNFTHTALIEIARRYNLTLDNLTYSNWQKLKPGSERGEQWMKNRIETDYAGGKIGLK